MAVLAGALHSTANKGVGPSGAGEFPFCAYLITIATSGTAEQISWRQWYNNGASKAAIYSSDKSTLLAETGSVTSPATGTRVGTLTPSVAVTLGQTYYVVITTNNDADTVAIQSNNDGTDVLESPTAFFASYAFPASFTSAGGGNNLGVPGITIDGTAGGGGGYSLAWVRA